MRKIVFSIVLVMSVVVYVACGVYAEPKVTENKDIKIVIDSHIKETTNVPILVNDRTMLPLREIATQLGVSNDDQHIKWDAVKKTVYLSKDNSVINLEINRKTATVNGKVVELDVAPLIYANRTYIPVRFVSQSFGKKVVWDDSSKSVLICNEEDYNKIKEILDKSNAAMKAAKKYKMEYAMNMNTTDDKNQKVNIMKFNIKSQFDMDKKKANLDVDASMLFIMNVKSQSYMDNNIVYTKDSFNNKWTKETKTEEEFKSEFLKDNQTSALDETDIVSAGLRLSESKNADEIVLTGDVILEELTDTPDSENSEENAEFNEVLITT